MRVLRVTPPCQIALDLPPVTVPAQRWWQLPEASRAQVLALLSRLIARGVLAEEDREDPAVWAQQGAGGGLEREDGRD